MHHSLPFTFCNFHFNLWGHLYMSSDLLFRERGPFSLKIISFSVRHMSHFFEPGLYCLQCLSISHFILGVSPFSLHDQKWFDSVVLFLYFSSVILDLCPQYLSLKVFSVLPMYVFVPVVAGALLIFQDFSSTL